METIEDVMEEKALEREEFSKILLDFLIWLTETYDLEKFEDVDLEYVVKDYERVA